MIGEHLNLSGRSLIETMIPRETPEESSQVYDTISLRVIEKLHPFMAQWIDNEGILKKIHDCLDIKTLELLSVNLIYPSIFSDVADALNAEEGLTDSERTYLLSSIADRMIQGAQGWMRENAHQRAQTIATAGKQKLGKIIGLDGKKAKPGKIIT